jgi:hypothetical protein
MDAGKIILDVERNISWLHIIPIRDLTAVVVVLDKWLVVHPLFSTLVQEEEAY